MYETIIVDPEVSSLDLLATFAKRSEDLRCVGTGRTGMEAIRLVEEHSPDLLVLAADLPDLDGWSVLRRLRHRPTVIMTASDPRQAATAFDQGAVDCLLRPVSAERFRLAWRRAVASLERHVENRPAGAADERSADRIYLRCGKRTIALSPREITHIQAEGPTSLVHAVDAQYRSTSSLGELQQLLSNEQFVRIHRSVLVNLDAIRSVARFDERRTAIDLDGGERVVASRQGSRTLRKLLAAR